MGITHKWNGSILTITSDSGTSSMDLQGPKGNKGCRGPQGRAGCIVKPDGTVDMTGYATETYVDEKLSDVQDIDLSDYYTKQQVLTLVDDARTDLTGYATEEYVNNAVDNIDLTGYATEDYVDNAVSNVDVDLTGYATENFVTTKIAAAQLEGAGVDVSGFVTQDDLNEIVAGGVGKPGTGANAEIFNTYEGTLANIASGDCAHAEGLKTIASGKWSHAEGNRTEATGTCAHAEGYGSKAINTSSHAEGDGTTASGQCSHAEGDETTARGKATHAEGNLTEAFADNSHAEGYHTRTLGTYSHTEGRGTIAEGAAQHVEGEYNAIEFDSHRLQYGVNSFTTSRRKYVHIVGNGTSDTERSNCHTLDWDGNAWFAGKVYVGGTSMDDAVELGSGGASVDLSNYYTKTEVDNKIAGSGGTVDLSSYATKSYVTGLGYQTEAQVLALIQANMAASGDGVSY